MKKLILIFTVFVSAGILLTSCGKDEPAPIPPDLKVHDLSVLWTLDPNKPYEGSCKIRITDMENKSLDTTTIASILKVAAGDVNNVAMLHSNEFGLINSGGMLRNFEYTSTSKDNIKFTMSEISYLNSIGGSIPTYYINWYKGIYGTINKLDIVLTPTTANYEIATKKLTFTYNGKIKLNVTTNGQSSDKENKVEYTYSLIKK